MTASGWPRVLMVDSERSWRGGQEQVRLLMKGLAEAGATLALAAPPGGALFERAAELGVDRIAWNSHGWLAGLGVLRRAMASGRFDVVHSHASRAHGAVSLAGVGLARRPVHVVSRRVELPVGRGPFGRWKYRRGADAYIAISNQVRDALVDGGVPAARIVVAPSGIDLDRFEGKTNPREARERLGVGAGIRVVGSIAALSREKGHADLLRAAAGVLAAKGDVRFYIVGEGELRERLERLARELGVCDRVVFTGFRADTLDLLGMFDVFVLSSRVEGLGTSIMDAQAAGIPVVATRTGGIPEIVEDGVSGLLVPPRSPESLGRAILRMLHDAPLREACVRAARERSRGYDYRNTVYKTLDVYRRLCEKHDLPSKKDTTR